MRHLTLKLLAFTFLASSTPSAQMVTRLGPPDLGLSQYDIHGLAGQPVTLPLAIANKGSKPLKVENVRPDGSIPCPKFKVFDRAGGPALTSHATTDCVMGATITLKPGERREFKVQLPFPLGPGEYTALLTVPTRPKAATAKANVRIGPGPFIPELRFPQVIKANKPIVMEVVFTNVWRSQAQDVIDLCRNARLLVRRGDGTLIVNEKRRDAPKCSTGLDSRPVSKRCAAKNFPHCPQGPTRRFYGENGRALLISR